MEGEAGQGDEETAVRARPGGERAQTADGGRRSWRR